MLRQRLLPQQCVTERAVSTRRTSRTRAKSWVMCLLHARWAGLISWLCAGKGCCLFALGKQSGGSRAWTMPEPDPVAGEVNGHLLTDSSRTTLGVRHVLGTLSWFQLG